MRHFLNDQSLLSCASRVKSEFSCNNFTVVDCKLEFKEPEEKCNLLNINGGGKREKKRYDLQIYQ